MASDCNFPNLTAYDQASLNDLLPVYPSAGAVSSQAPSNTSIEAISLIPTKKSPLSIQPPQPLLQDNRNNSEPLLRFPRLLPIINIIATTEAHLQRSHIPVDEAMLTNKACMS